LASGYEIPGQAGGTEPPQGLAGDCSVNAGQIQDINRQFENISQFKYFGTTVQIKI
jgi:hypothetical protein